MLPRICCRFAHDAVELLCQTLSWVCALTRAVCKSLLLHVGQAGVSAGESGAGTYAMDLNQMCVRARTSRQQTTGAASEAKSSHEPIASCMLHSPCATRASAPDCTHGERSTHVRAR